MAFLNGGAHICPLRTSGNPDDAEGSTRFFRAFFFTGLFLASRTFRSTVGGRAIIGASAAYASVERGGLSRRHPQVAASHEGFAFSGTGPFSQYVGQFQVSEFLAKGEERMQCTGICLRKRQENSGAAG